MDLIPVLLPLAKARLKDMSTAEKRQTLALVTNICNVLSTGDREVIGLLCDQLNVSDKVRDLVVTEFAVENQTG